MLSFLFPQYLGRLAFLGRLIPLEIFSGFCLADLMTSGKWDSNRFTTLAVLVGLVIYGVFFVFLPRVRDCSMPGWTLFFALIPVASTLYGLILVYGGSRVLQFSGSKTPDPADPPPPVAGGKCIACGKSLILATDGVMNPYGGVLCNDCHQAQEVA